MRLSGQDSKCTPIQSLGSVGFYLGTWTLRVWASFNCRRINDAPGWVARFRDSESWGLGFAPALGRSHLPEKLSCMNLVIGGASLVLRDLTQGSRYLLT